MEIGLMATSSKLAATLVGVAGEYFVAAELSRRGYVASLTLRNTRGIDLLVSNRDATKSVGIQVKTNQGGRPDWILNKKAEADVATNLFYVFVALHGLKSPEFFVVPRSHVSAFVKKGHQAWLAAPGKRGQAHRDTDMRHFKDPERKYRDRWDLLELGPASAVIEGHEGKPELLE